MRNAKFILAAIAILLTGAIAAGLAARAVTAPDGEQVQSAGTVTIPTVLGQSAEEVLFYPWSLYDTETLSPVPENYLADIFGLSPEDLSGLDLETIGDLIWDGNGFTAILLCPFELPAGPVECDIPALFRALQWNMDEDGHTPAGGTHLFLDNYPAVLRDSEAPAALSMAMSSSGSRTDYSFLIRPAKPREVTEEEQRAALTLVKAELLDLLLNSSYFNYEISDEELYSGLLMAPNVIASDYRPAEADELPAGPGGIGITATQPNEGSALGRMLRNYLRPDGSYCVDWVTSRLTDLFYPLTKDPKYVWLFFSETPTLDDLLDTAADMGLSVQLVTTQGQIVVLFSGSASDAILGLYYDIQLGSWSGIGWRAV